MPIIATVACASFGPPPPQAAERAAAAFVYSGSLRVSLRGPELRGRSAVLIAFRRPDAVRLEIPGPSGARLVAVARDGRLTAVLPRERAVFEAAASAETIEALLGIALGPEELMDLLVGRPPSRVRQFSTRWDTSVPRRIEAVLPDGTRLEARVDEAELDPLLSPAVFDPPAHSGYRRVDAAEARRLLGWSS
jgi:hypothetical protein